MIDTLCIHNTKEYSSYSKLMGGWKDGGMDEWILKFLDIYPWVRISIWTRGLYTVFSKCAQHTASNSQVIHRIIYSFIFVHFTKG